MTTDVHLSTFALDALALDALTRDEAEHARLHLEKCTRCQAVAAQGAQLRDSFASRVERTLEGARQRNRSWRRWFALRVATPIFALAALVLVLVRLRGEPAVADEPEIGIKGSSPILEVYARRGEKVFPVRNGTVLAPGDEIRFAVVPQGLTQVLIASIDGAGTVTMYYPYNAQRSGTVEPNRRTELPGSIVLDATPGPERLVAAFSRAPIRAAELAAELRRQREGAGGQNKVDNPRGGRRTPDQGVRRWNDVTQVSITIEKAQ